MSIAAPKEMNPMDSRTRIAMIDDDPDILETARRVLERAGFEVHVYAKSFNVANFIARVRPHLVLMDVNMPFLSGDQLARLLQRDEELKRVPVVFFSSNDESTLRRLVQEMGVLGYIAKSSLGVDLAGKVDRFVKKSRVEGRA